MGIVRPWPQKHCIYRVKPNALHGLHPSTFSTGISKRKIYEFQKTMLGTVGHPWKKIFRVFVQWRGESCGIVCVSSCTYRKFEGSVLLCVTCPCWYDIFLYWCSCLIPSQRNHYCKYDSLYQSMLSCCSIISLWNIIYWLFSLCYNIREFHYLY